ncbi:hypothetical protein LC593_31375 [Nostoc sp. CHAB 5844]|nr:hypothetical protein [Nostoc sp. CHAB 5844]
MCNVGHNYLSPFSWIKGDREVSQAERSPLFLWTKLWRSHNAFTDFWRSRFKTQN